MIVLSILCNGFHNILLLHHQSAFECVSYFLLIICKGCDPEKETEKFKLYKLLTCVDKNCKICNKNDIKH